MKRSKKFLALAAGAALVLSLLTACGGNSGSGGSGSSGSGDSDTGRVYWLNFKPELDGTAQELARPTRRRPACPSP